MARRTAALMTAAALVACLLGGCSADSGDSATEQTAANDAAALEELSQTFDDLVEGAAGNIEAGGIGESLSDEIGEPSMPASAIKDGVYSVTMLSDSDKFRPLTAFLTVEGDTMEAEFILANKGYSRLYLGTVDEAEALEGAGWFDVDNPESDRDTFTIPLTALNTDIPVAAYNPTSETWRQFTIAFDSRSLSDGAEGR